MSIHDQMRMERNQMKRYCIFSAQYFPHLGGVERYTYNLAKTLVKRGNEVTIVTSNTYHIESYEQAEGISIYRIPCYRLLDGRYPVLKPDKGFRKLHKRIWETPYDMVIINTRFYIHSLYAAYQSKRRKIPCITIEHGTSHLSVHHKVWDTIGAVYEFFLTQAGRLFCKEYYGVSLACNKWLEHFGIKGKGVLYNSIDLGEVKELQRTADHTYRKRFHISQETVVITFTGRLLKEKGLPQLMNVIDRLHAEGEDCCLMIAGDGDMEEEIRKRGSDFLIPLGRLSFQEIISLLDESDIFCLPSFSEGFSTSILEAGACGCYVVTTARGGAKELLLDENYGSVLPDNEEEGLYKELKRLLMCKEERQEAAKRTYKRIEECFTWEIVADSIEKISGSKK